MREGKKKESTVNKRSLSIIGFIISIVLLLVAIILSANEEKTSREARVNRNSVGLSEMQSLEQASSELTRSVNELKNEIGTTENITAPEQVANTNSIINENQSNEEDNESQENKNSAESNTNGAKDEGANNVEEKVQEQFIKPVDGENIASYSMDSLIYSNTLQEWITHRGIDIKADKTTVVKASASGTVKSIKEDPRYGLSITIEHSDGFQTAYSSLLSAEFVKEGDKVEQGQSIGTIGNSAVFESGDGSHLHFEILKDGEYVNPDIYIK